MKNIKTLFYSVLVVLLFTGTVLIDNSVKAQPQISGEEITAYHIDEVNLSIQDVKRVGAKCCDGTNSKATGRGACSHHGGVKYWKMSDGTKVSTGRCD